MKSKLYTYIIVVFLFSLFLMSKASIGVNIDTSTSSIKVDKLTIDIVQKADINTFKIDQFYYINNTGDDFFNDSFYIWVPDDCNIISDCCDGAANMGCRLDAKDEMWCFNFNKTEFDNIYVGEIGTNKVYLFSEGYIAQDISEQTQPITETVDETKDTSGIPGFSNWSILLGISIFSFLYYSRKL